MNVETLHAIARAVLQDFEGHDIPGKLQRLVAAAQNRVNSPTDASYPQQFDKLISELRDDLPELSANTFPPLWREYLSELNSNNWIGKHLLDAIEAILSKNAITPTMAYEELKDLQEEISEDISSLKSLRAAFDRFGIGTDSASPGTAEIGILIPRRVVHDNLSEFGAELRKLSRIVAVFRETVHGDRPDVKLKTIASSEFSVLCLIDFETAKLISKSVGQLIEGYKILVGLKEQIQRLREVGVPDDKLTGVIDHANEQMTTTVNAITEEIVTRFPDGRIQETRKRELKIELAGALGEIATRVDQGFSFEIRAAKPEKPTGEEPPDKQAARELAETSYEEIASRQSTLQYLKTNGSPILSLPGLPPEERQKEPSQC